MSINRVIISGNLTRDPELRSTQSGTSVLAVGVAVNDRRQNPQTGEWEDHPNYVDCVVWGRRADALADMLHKGSKVAIEGRLRYRSWEAQDGAKRSKLEVAVDELEFMSPRTDRTQAPHGQAYPQQAPGRAYVPQPGPQKPAYATQQPQAAVYPAPAPYAAPQPLQQQIPTMPQPQAPTMDVYDEDIPF